MPILIANKRYNNTFNPVQNVSFYRSNVGDRNIIELEIHSSIAVRSINNPINFDNFVNEITSAAVSFIEEGFRVGDSIQIIRYDAGGLVNFTGATTINYFDGPNTVGVSSLGISGYDIATESIAIIVNGRNRADLDLLINHVPNGQIGSGSSLLDGEITRAKFLNVNSLAMGGTLAGQLIPNQSGEFINDFPLEITRTADYNSFTRVFVVELSFATNGVYNQSLFTLGNCLKAYYRFEWSSLPNEVQNKAILVDSEDADTGWFGQGFNSQSPNSEIILNGLTELKYCNDTTFEIIVDGTDLSEIGIGAVYISQDDDYYKNKATSQRNLSMLLDTKNVNTNIGVPKVSPQNPDFANYFITINSVVTAGSEVTINATFSPQNNFSGFFQTREEGDRLFYVWIKCGNVNHLIYSSQLICPPIPLGPLNMLEENSFIQHFENTLDAVAEANDTEFNTEDDLAFSGVFELDKGEDWDAVNVILEAYNSVTEARFTLQSVVYNLLGVQISNDGKYLVNESQNIVSTLPNTSVKRLSTLTLDPNYETAFVYAMRIYYPFLLRWEYWIAQANANVDFFPNQNKNWFPYDNTGDWGVRLQLQLQKGGGAKTFEADLDILDYDSNSNIISTTELFLQNTGQNVSAVVEGEIHRIEVTHELVSGTWDINKVWGMITVEPKEAARRWILSTIVPQDNNPNNPLFPISGNFASIQQINPSIIVVSCLFDSGKINLTNGVKFTGKIKQQCTDVDIVLKEMTTNEVKKMTTDNDKIIS